MQQCTRCSLPEQMYLVDVAGTTVVGGAGGAAVPHLRCAADARGGGAGAAVQFMMHALRCMSDGKGTWGWSCVCMRGADACVCMQGYVSASVEGWIPVEYFDPSVAGKEVSIQVRQTANGEDYVWPVNSLVFHPVCIAHVCLCAAATDPCTDTARSTNA